jgi:hypothetical protein
VQRALERLGATARATLPDLPASVGNKARRALENLIDASNHSADEIMRDLWTLFRQVFSLKVSFHGLSMDLLKIVEIILDIPGT